MLKLITLILFGLLKLTTCSQNQAPRFNPPLQSNYFFPEFNSTKPGDVLLWLNATDQDNDDLQFGVEGDFYKKLLTVKKIERNKAVVLAKQLFDREVQEKYENIVFYVQDKPGNKVFQSVRFVILDIDDNAPVFRGTPYKVNIIENQPVNSVVYSPIEAFDADGPLYNKLTFSIVKKPNEPSSSFGLFAIEKCSYISSGHYNTSVILKNKLDYSKSKTHVVTIAATGENSKFVTYAELVVNVIDYPNKPPEFSQSPYYVKIEEEMSLGAYVLQVSAKDGDTGINNPCKYRIDYASSPIASSYFKIDELNGVITIRKRIDLESEEISKLGGLLDFKIIASEVGDENSMQEAQVTVAVSDINDNVPRFNRKTFHLVISPKSTVGTSLTLSENDTDSIHVFDSDKGINGSFSLVLSKLDDNDAETFSQDFEVIPRVALNDANLIIKVKNQNNLINKIGSIEHYRLIAKDKGINGNISHADLFIKIEIINQYPPQFERELYTFYVDENSPFNTTIDFLNAFDNDTFGNFGLIVYELKNGQERFQIDRDTGRIYTISMTPTQQLDREVIDTFYMSVDAIDGGGLRTSVQIIIKLNDMNDNVPQFLNNLFNMNSFINNTNISNNIIFGYIEENSAKWLEPIRLQAVDRDIGLNGEVIYEILKADFMQEYFRIDEVSNFISLRDNMTLDFEELYRLHHSQNVSNPLQLPSSGQQVNSLVLNSGEIDINLIISARDLGFPSLSSTIIAKIIVKDVNDHIPKFDKLFYSTQVLETAKAGDVFQVNAIDLDAPNTPNSRVNYRIESGSRDKFLIDSTTGMVKINENAQLDKDLFGSFYTLRIIANDFGTALNLNGKKTSSQKNYPNNLTNNLAENFCYLRIEIVDVNNKIPEFTTKIESVSISEGSPINTPLIQIKAEDLDSDADLRYFLLNSNDDFKNTFVREKFEAFNEYSAPVDTSLVKNWFGIHQNNGTIFTKSLLDRELVEEIHLVIGVEDVNAAEEFKPQIRTRSLKVKIIDINDNYPMFIGIKQLNVNHTDNDEEPIFEHYENIEENTKVNTRIIQLKAFDLDKFRNISYKILHSSDKSKFLALNQTTGDIFIKNSIDHEDTKWINMTILAFDNGLPSRKHSLLHLYFKIDDLNDNAPKFVQSNVTEFRIYENAPINTVISTFKAIDHDSNHFGTIIYKILSGDDGKFGIDAVKGTLYVKSLIDREEKDLYSLVIQAIDNPINEKNRSSKYHQQLSDSLLVKIKILDVNDNSPRCERDIYVIETMQNAEINTSLCLVKGLDNDIGKNSELTYSMILLNNSVDDDLFRLNGLTGQIHTNKKLFAHAGIFFYNLTITDNGDKVNEDDSTSALSIISQTNIKRSGSCMVKILVKEFNSHAPVFVYPNLLNSTFRIKASTKPGSYILTVNATDEDKGSNGLISYYLDENKAKNDDWKSFELDKTTGVLTLNRMLNINRQSLYSIDIIALDQGRPNQLSTRQTLTLIVVDDSNNAAQFDRTQICLDGSFQCEKDFETLIVRFREEEDVLNLNNGVKLNLAKMNDLSKSDDEICYYLNGQDKSFFKLNKKTGLLMPKKKMNREYKEKYELILKSSEYCSCLNLDNELENESADEILQNLTNFEVSQQCEMAKLFNDTYDPNDISQLRVNVYLDDINDNPPYFLKKFFQVGVTSDVEFGEVILESHVVDPDSSSNLNLTINKSSFIIKEKETVKGSMSVFPFSLEFFDGELTKNNSKAAKFQIKTQNYFRETQLTNKNHENIIYQFNISVFDPTNATNYNDTTTVQVVMIKKQQRVKLVFSQSLDKVLSFQEEFQNYIGNLTGYRAFVDKISVHRSDDDDENASGIGLATVTSQHGTLTDMLLHFTQNYSKYIDSNLVERKLSSNGLNNNNNMTNGINGSEEYIINADKILNLLDKSKDIHLLRKYKLTLAEKYDDNGHSTFYKYGTSLDDDFGNFFLWTPSSSKSSIYSSYTSRMILIILSSTLLFFSLVILLFCYFMRKKYLRKLKAERAMTKAFGFEQRSLTFNDALTGYINSAFDSNSLLPIPGTNLYAYEGSNPIWLKKYDKIEAKTDQSTASSSSTTASSSGSSKSCINNSSTNLPKSKNKESNCLAQVNNEDISSFYLKQVDASNTPILSRSSPMSGLNNTNNTSSDKTNNTNKANENVTLTSDILSIQDASPHAYEINTNLELNNTNSFKTDTSLLTFAPSNSNKYAQSQVNTQLNESFVMRAQFKNNQVNSNNKQILNSFTNNQLLATSLLSNNNNYNKIFDNSTPKQDGNNYVIVNANNNNNNNLSNQLQTNSKDQITNQLFAVESTII